MTRPAAARGGYGLSVAGDATAITASATAVYGTWPKVFKYFDEWQRISLAHGVSGAIGTRCPARRAGCWSRKFQVILTLIPVISVGIPLSRFSPQANSWPQMRVLDVPSRCFSLH